MDHTGHRLREEVMLRTSECYDLSASLEEKLEKARELFRRWGDRLLAEPDIASGLQRMEEYIEKTWEVMFRAGVVETCKYCDEQEGGSCCGAGIDMKYDPVLLLMNLLLGVPLPDRRHEEGSCFFLGERGCKLKVRLVLCVDYLCPKLRRKLDHDDLVELQTVSGDELLEGFILYDAIKTRLRRWNHEG